MCVCLFDNNFPYTLEKPNQFIIIIFIAELEVLHYVCGARLVIPLKHILTHFQKRMHVLTLQFESDSVRAADGDGCEFGKFSEKRIQQRAHSLKNYAQTFVCWDMVFAYIPLLLLPYPLSMGLFDYVCVCFSMPSNKTKLKIRECFLLTLRS